MRSLTYSLAFVTLTTLLAGCPGPNPENGAGGAGGSGSTTTTSGSGGPSSCDQTNHGVGCCDPNGLLWYCDTNSNVQSQPCTDGNVCGWNASQNIYDCVGTAGADPSNQNPMACGGDPSTAATTGATTSSGSTTSTTSTTSTSTSSTSSTSSTASSSSSSSASSSGNPATTWTDLYNNVFGPNGSSSCSRNGGCHTGTQSGFKCGSSKSTCYNGMVNSGLVTTGAQASSSVLADPNQSPLCGSLGGNMPKNGTCPSASVVAELQSWLAAGAPNN